MTQFGNLQEYWDAIKRRAEEEVRKKVKEGKAIPRTKSDRGEGNAN